MTRPESVTLSRAECEALHELISQLSGHNPENVFAWDGSDDISDPSTIACVKVFLAAGRSVPESMRGAT